MKRAFAVVVCLLLFSSVAAGFAGWDDVEPINDATPSDATEQIHIESPHHEDASAQIEADSQTKYEVSIWTDNSQSKTYYIGLNETNVFDWNDLDQLTVTVDGEPVEWETQVISQQQWIIFETNSENPTVTVSSSAGTITELVDVFSGNPMILISVAILLIIAVTLGVRWLSAKQAVVYY